MNMLVRVEGTPLGDRPPEDPLELVRMIATARILMPASIVRLSAGRLSLSDEAQALCFLAGANSVFLGDKLLTTPNPAADVDRRLFDRPRPAAAARRRPLTAHAAVRDSTRVGRRLRADSGRAEAAAHCCAPPAGIDFRRTTTSAWPAIRS